MALTLRAMGAPEMDWLSAPPAAALAAANSLLDKLSITPAMADLPLPPTAGKTCHGSRAARRTGEGMRRSRGVERRRARIVRFTHVDGIGMAAANARESSSSFGADSHAATQEATTRFFSPCSRPSRIGSRGIAATANCCFLREGRRVFRIAATNSSSPSTWRSAATPALPLVRLAARIEPEWLLEKATERTTLEWNRAAERVDQVSALLYDQLVLEETRGPAPDTDETARMLAEKALEADIGRFADKEALEQLRARASFAGIEIDVNAALISLCRGRSSFAQLASANLLASLLVSCGRAAWTRKRRSGSPSPAAVK